MIKMLQYKMYPAGELAVLRQLLLSDCTVCHSSMDFCSNFRMSIANNCYYIEYSKKNYIIFRVIIIFEYKLSKGIKGEYLVIILGYFFLISLFLLSYFFFWDIFFLLFILPYFSIKTYVVGT